MWPYISKDHQYGTVPYRPSIWYPILRLPDRKCGSFLPTRNSVALAVATEPASSICHCSFAAMPLEISWSICYNFFRPLVEASMINGETANGMRSAPYLNFSDRVYLAIAAASSHCNYRRWFMGALRRSPWVISGSSISRTSEPYCFFFESQISPDSSLTITATLYHHQRHYQQHHHQQKIHSIPDNIFSTMLR